MSYISARQVVWTGAMSVKKSGTVIARKFEVSFEKLEDLEDGVKQPSAAKGCIGNRYKTSRIVRN